MKRYLQICFGILLILVGWDATAQVTASKPASGSVLNCANPLAFRHFWDFQGATVGTPIQDKGCVGGANLTIVNTNGHISFVDDATHGRVMRFTGANTTDYASVNSNLGADTDGRLVIAYRTTSATNPTNIGFLAGWGNTATATYSGVAIPATNGRFGQRRIHTAQTAIVTTVSTTDYADGNVNLGSYKVQTTPAGPLQGAAVSINGGAYNAASDANIVTFAGVQNRFGIGAEMKATLSNFLGDASVNVDIIFIGVDDDEGYSSYDDAQSAAIYNSGDPYTAIGLGGCVTPPTVNSVDVDNNVGEAQQNVVWSVTDGCTAGTVTLEQGANVKTLTQVDYTATSGHANFSDVGWKAAGNLLYGLTDFCITTAAGKDCLEISIYPESDHKFVVEGVGPIAFVGAGPLVITPPVVWPDGSKTLVFTDNAAVTDQLDTVSGYEEIFVSEDEAISFHCHTKLPGETTIPNFVWGPSPSPKVGFAMAVTGGAATCQGLTANLQIQPHAQDIANFPWTAATVPSDGALVIKIGGKAKTAVGNAITYGVSTGFTRAGYLARNGVAQIFIAEYQIQTQREDIPAGEWTALTGTPETTPTNGLTIVLNGDAPTCWDFTSGSKLPLAYDPTYGYFNRLFGYPIDISVPGSQVTLSSTPVPSGVELNGDLSLVINSLVRTYQYNFSDASTDLYLGPIASVDVNNPPPLFGGVVIPNQIYAVGTPIRPYSVSNYFTLGSSPLSNFQYRRLVTPTPTTQANGSGVSTTSLIVDSLSGLNKKDWIRVGTSYAQIKYLNPFTNEAGLYFPISWGDNDAVSIMSQGTCVIGGLVLDPLSGQLSGTPNAEVSQDLCFFRLNAVDGSFADSR